MKSIIFTLLLLVSAQVYAGDYMLFVADKDNKSDCSNQKHWTVKTSEELVTSFKQYFRGETPNIGILHSAFSNGHFHFCGTNEIKTVLNALYKIREDGPKEHKSHLSDFIAKIEAIN